MARLKQTMNLAWTKEIAPNVLHVALKPEQEFQFIPGQFVTLHFQTIDQETNEPKEAKRSYSIANAPKSPDSSCNNGSEFIEFAISYQKHGLASEFIFNMHNGDAIEVSGPAGRLVLLDHNPARYILIATGTGVTPYRSMLNQIQQILDSSNTKFLLLFGVRNHSECLYYSEFTEFASRNKNFQFEIYYSRELPTESDISDMSSLDNIHQGYVQTGFDQYMLNPEQDMIYLCGNPNMIDEAYPILVEKGFTAKTVRREKYISSK